MNAPPTSMRFFAVVALIGLPSTALGHAMAPTLLRIDAMDESRALVLLKQPLDAESREAAKIRIVLDGACRFAQEPAESRAARSVTHRGTLDCEKGLRGKSIAVSGLESSVSDVVYTVRLDDGEEATGVLTLSAPRFIIPRKASAREVLASYGALGVEHILSGFDHLMFVLALMLLVRSRRHLLWTVTAFTVGHSITLSLAALDLVRVASRPTEVAIALSLLLLAVELSKDTPSLTKRAPFVIAGFFGTVHGLGFAGALRELGLPKGAVPEALFAFNVGVELGQLLFIAAVLALGLLLGAAHRSMFRPQIVRALGVLSALFVFQRLFSA